MSIAEIINNKVLFAGEHVSGKHGWIQGALHSAMIAANNIAYLISTDKHK
ncbi:FAD-dependent oxidoreductase [Caloramator mitchellensis]